jgi:adenine-specific DNA-methyltransferase
MSKLRAFKKALRSAQTDAEEMLWYHLRNRNTANLKFRRQHVLQGFIVDFVCLEKKLVVELDGSQHAETKAQIYDEQRTGKLEEAGFYLMRFWNSDVFNHLDGVLEAIYIALEAR